MSAFPLFHVFPTTLTSYFNSHNYPDPQAVKILAAIRLSNPTKILVIDRMVVPELQVDAPVVDGNNVPLSSQKVPTMYDLVMAALPGGRARTVEEWRSLFAMAGLKLVNIHPLRASTGQAVLEGVPI